MSLTKFQATCLSTFLLGILSSSHTASAQVNGVVASGIATGYIQSIYSSWDYYYHRFAVPYDQYADGAFMLKGFANGKDMMVRMTDETDEYDDVLVSIDDCEGVGHNIQYAPFPEYPHAIYDVYYFDEPLVFGWEQMEFVYMDETTHYNPFKNALVLDYQSPVDQDEYLFIAYFDEEWDGELPTGIDEVSTEATSTHYDLMGRRVSQQGSGLRISNGKVSLQR